MPESSSPVTLEGLVATCNVDFGYRLLARHRSEALEFEHFVEVADAMVGENPKKAAIHLAGLVAMEVARSEKDTIVKIDPAEN